MILLKFVFENSFFCFFAESQKKPLRIFQRVHKHNKTWWTYFKTEGKINQTLQKGFQSENVFLLLVE